MLYNATTNSNIIIYNKIRITLLTPRLFRLEYSSTKMFDDRITLSVINREFPPINHKSISTDSNLLIDTGEVKLTYSNNSES